MKGERLFPSRLAAGLVLSWIGIVAVRALVPDPLFWTALHASLQAGFLLLAAFGLGAICLAPFPKLSNDRWEGLFFRATAGLGAVALLTLGIGWAGLLREEILWPLLAGLAVWGGRRIWLDRILQAAVRSARSRRYSFLEVVLLGSAAAAMGLYFLTALAPPTFFDSMVYHLALPDRFARAGRIAVDPDFAFSYFPMNMEMLYTLGRVLFTGHQVLNLLNFSVGILLLLGTACLGRRIGDSRTGLLAAAVLALTPCLGLLAVVPKNDLALALFELAAFIAWCRWFLDGDRSALLPAGIFAGFACGTKYAGIYFLVALGLATAVLALRRGGLKRLPVFQSIFLAGILALAIFSPWWGRNLVLTGNPVYPTLQGLFPSGEHLNRQGNRISIEKGGRTDLGGLLRAPWDMTFHPAEFRFFSQIGPFYLALLLPLIYSSRLRREIPLILFTALFAFLFWWVTRPNTRYLLGILALLAAGSAGVLLRLPARNRAWGAVLGGFLILLVPLNLVTYLSVERVLFDSLGLVLGTGEDRNTYLARRLDYYPAARFINDSLPGDARILMVGETRTYYIDREVRVSSAHNRSLAVRWAEEGKNARGFLEILRREGITHLLVNRREGKRLAAGYAYFNFPDRESRAAFATVMREETCPVYSGSEVSILTLGPCVQAARSGELP